MEQGVAPLIVMAGLALAALAGFAYYRWRQRRRARGVEEWVRGYLRDRYGAPLDDVRIDCSDDHLWPVLVGFDDPRTRMRHRLRFSCPGPPSTFALQSEGAEQR